MLARAKKEKLRRPAAPGAGEADRDAAAPAVRGGARGVRGGPEVGRKAGRSAGARADAGVSGEAVNERRDLLRRQDKIHKALEKNEARIHEINEQFSNPGFFATVSHEQVRKLENEQKRLKGEINGLMTEWQQVDEALGRMAEEPSRA